MRWVARLFASAQLQSLHVSLAGLVVCRNVRLYGYVIVGATLFSSTNKYYGPYACETDFFLLSMVSLAVYRNIVGENQSAWPWCVHDVYKNACESHNGSNNGYNFNKLRSHVCVSTVFMLTYIYRIVRYTLSIQINIRTEYNTIQHKSHRPPQVGSKWAQDGVVSGAPTKHAACDRMNSRMSIFATAGNDLHVVWQMGFRLNGDCFTCGFHDP